jgi:hypothetical protein
MGVREVEMVDLMGVEKGNAEGGGMDLVEVKEKVKGCLRMSEEEVEDLVFLGGESKREGSTFSES